MVHYAGYTPRFHPSDFQTYTARRGRRGLADRLRRPQAVTTSCSKQELPVAGQDWPWGDPHTLPAPRPPGRRQRRDLPARREGRRHRSPGRSGGHPQRPVRQPAALHLPRLLPAGLQGQRQSQPADHPHPRRPGPRRRDPARLHGHPGRRRRPHRRRHRRHLLARRRRALPAGPRWWRSPATRSRRRGCCCCRPPTRYPTGWATTTTRSAAT